MPLATLDSFVDELLQSQLLDAEQWEELPQLQASALDSRDLAKELLRRDWLTAYQVNQIIQGKGASLSLGPFTLLERLGEGGMGQVFKARQNTLNRIVALKVIRKECLDNPKITLRFEREIRAAGQVSHPHIVRTYDADQVNGTYYIAMELIDGFDLAKLVKENGPLPVDQALDYIRQAALGLQHAHERGLVHRDIKPANLLMTPTEPGDRRRSSGALQRPVDLLAKRLRPIGPQCPWGIVKILDLGLARCTEPSVGETLPLLTQVGAMMGTPEFIAPEQARDSHSSDIRADLYSLGCTLYFLLTGQPPFPKGNVTEKLMQHQVETAAPVAEVRRDKLLARNGAANVSTEMLRVPAPVDRLLRKLLSKSPDDRYQTPIELANAIQVILQQFATGAFNAKPTDRGPIAPQKAIAVPALAAQPAQVRRRSGMVALILASLGGLALIAVLTLIAAVMSRGNQTHAVEPEPAVRSDRQR